jgi:hypothetical protein
MIETIRPGWPAPANVHACCSTRHGGVSRAPYDSLNLGLHVGDRVADVVANRKRLAEALALPAEPCWINQTHSIDVVTLEDDPRRDADAAITRQAGRVAVVMTADCLPILLCDRAGSEVAAVHAGWRGLQAGVIQAALAAMQSSGEELLAWIGPGISQPNFEVGDEVYAAFVDDDPAASASFLANRPGHWLCDLPGLAERVLREAGVGLVERSQDCSYADTGRFFSYRREAVTGRMASLIWIS